MKKLFFSILFALALIIPAANVSAQEQINSLSVYVGVNEDSSIKINEEIVYNFDQPRHGIFRTIPYKYSRNGFNYNLRITDISVTDSNGNAYLFETSRKSGELEIKIGDPDVTIAGEHVYSINYTVKRAINFFENHDELYWNAVGTDWAVPINKVKVEVALPAKRFETGDVKFSCFAGVLGTTNPCASSFTSPNGWTSFGHDQLQPHEGVTVVVGWPKGVVVKPLLRESIIDFLWDNSIFLLPIVGLFIMLYVWYRFGRDPKSKLPVTAQYETPDKLTPVQIGYLVDERSQNQEITAEIIYLATQGFLKIERIPKKGWLGKDDFKLIKLKDEKELPEQFDQNLLRTLFSVDKTEVLLSTLKKSLKVTADTFGLKTIPKLLTKKGYYSSNPDTVRTAFMVTAGVVGFGVIWLVAGFLSVSVIISLVATAIIVGIVGYNMPRKTEKGADTKQLILGFKEYLSVAEKDRLDFHNDPAKDPKIFEKFLPYAIALGVSKQWAQKFEGLFTYSPSWYVDPSNSAFNSILFYSAINDFSSGFNNMIVAKGSTAGSGGSGFSGGFSGGGGGGGGGGSW